MENSFFGHVVPNKKSKNKRMNNGCHGYPMTSSQIKNKINW